MKLTEKATWCQPIGRASQAVWEQNEEAVAILCTKCHSSPQQARKRKCVKWIKNVWQRQYFGSVGKQLQGCLAIRSEILSAVLEPFYPFYLLALMCYPRFNKMQQRKALARTARSLLQWQGHAHHRTNLQASADKKKMKRQRPFANLLRMNIE